MKINEKGLNLVKEFEGCYLTAYRCPAGVLTIGYGHTGSDVTEGMKITKAKATSLLKSDMSKFEKAVEKYNSKYNFNENQFSALVSFTFNCGEGNLKTLTANGTRSISEISNKLLAYNKAAGKELAGLTRRRKAEKELFDEKVEESTKTVEKVSKVETVEVTASRLNCRNRASMKGDVVGIFNKGAKLKVKEKLEGWHKVSGEYNGKTITGYCSSKYLK